MNKILSKSVKKTKITETKSKKLTAQDIKDIQEKELKKIKKFNKIFLKATPSEKRIMIAQDVIEQIKLGKYIPEAGEYFKTSNKIKDQDLQCVIASPKFKCNVCELGGLFTSIVKITNEFKADGSRYIESYEMKDKLKAYFSVEQLSLVEAAFEENCFGQAFGNSTIPTKNFLLAESYRKRKKFEKYPLYKVNETDFNYNKRKQENDRLAMVSICKNIITNKGSFRPSR